MPPEKAFRTRSEYARGLLPTLIPFGLADALSSTLDFKTAWQTLAIYPSLVLRSQARGRKLAVGTLATTIFVLGLLARRRVQRRK